MKKQIICIVMLMLTLAMSEIKAGIYSGTICHTQW